MTTLFVISMILLGLGILSLLLVALGRWTDSDDLVEHAAAATLLFGILDVMFVIMICLCQEFEWPLVLGFVGGSFILVASYGLIWHCEEECSDRLTLMVTVAALVVTVTFTFLWYWQVYGAISAENLLEDAYEKLDYIRQCRMLLS
ncbi:TPA: hypothetical protein DF272_04380 [Candidatus Falkowbacteria bacterium]|nr:hypothetical protein [Candidatus Falkowbacteria bacterium]